MTLMLNFLIYMFVEKMKETGPEYFQKIQQKYVHIPGGHTILKKNPNFNKNPFMQNSETEGTLAFKLLQSIKYHLKEASHLY